MKIFWLKLSIITLGALTLVCFGFQNTRVRANSGGPPASRTGAPSEQTCALSGCHTSFALNSGSGSLTLSGLPATYLAGQDVVLTVTLTQAGALAFGFQVTALDDQGRSAGTLTVTEGNRTQRTTSVVGGALRQYIQHSFNGSLQGGNQGVWTFRWTAPALSTGRVTFYVAGNAADGRGSESGDRIYTRSFSVQPTTGPQAVATVSAASFSQGALASETIAALFAAGGLSDATVAATSVPLPTTLNNVVVKVKDTAGVERDAPLFFVSAAQINFLVPQGTGNGAATITVLKSGSAVGAGTLNIETVTPGLFTANSNGQGVPAAVLFRQTAGGQQTLEPVSVFNTLTNRFEPVEINLGLESDIVIIILFGTGFRNRTSLGAVSATIGGVNAPVDFAAAQGDLAGLDQANIRIPKTLGGRGLVNLNFIVDSKAANTVQLNIK